MEQRVDRLEYRMDKLEEKVEKQGLEYAETRVYVKEIYKKMDAIAASLDAMKTKVNGKWERFFEKSFWLVAGAICALVASNLHF